MSNPLNQIYEFGQFQVNASERLLLRQGETVPIAPKVFDLLLVMIQRQGAVVEKDELMQLLWPDTYVEENNLTVSMSALRKVLGEGKDGAKYIETIPRRGYRFVVPIAGQTPNHLQTSLTASPADHEAAKIALANDAFGKAEAIIDISDVSEAVPPPPSFSLQVPDFSKVSVASVPKDESREGANGLAESSVTKNSALVQQSRSVAAPKTLLWAGSALVLVLVIGYWWKQRTPLQVSDIRSIAVLPFKSLSGTNRDLADESLGLGLADALITRLSNTGRIVVRPTSAIVKYSTPNSDALVAGRELDVDALLDGRLQRVGDRVRITVQFLRLSDGAPLWAESFDEQFTNILAVQNIISEKVAYALTLKLTETERQRLTKRYTENTEAFEAYLKGRYFWNKRESESLKKAIGYFEQAIELDPLFALAYAGIADCYIILGTPQSTLMGKNGEDYQSKARVAAQKALEIDETLAEAHASLGASYAPYDDVAAHREFDRAIELNPNYATTYTFYAIDLIGDARLEDALEKAKKAREIDPLSVPINSNYGMVLCRLRRVDEAVEQFKKTLELEPNAMRAHWGLGLVYEQKGQFDNAIAEFQRAIKLSNGGVLALASLGHVYGVLGRRTEAEQIVQQLLEKEKNGGERHPYYLAAVYAGMGDKDRAFEVLEKNRGQYSRGLMKNDQFFDSLRSDPRYEAIMRD